MNEKPKQVNRKAFLLAPVEGKGTRHGIAPGSAIASFDVSNDHGNVAYYEGNLFGAENLKTYEGKVICAYYRLRDKYPTVAMTCFNRGDFEVIGSFENGVISVVNQGAYDKWVNSPTS